jgi:hypothetical protein
MVRKAARLDVVCLERRDLPAPLGILTPAYFYPAPGSDWDKLTAAAPYVPVTAILNPNSGPGAAVDPNYAAAVDHLRAAGGKVIGYVHTSYTNQPLSRVYAEINDYRRWYHLDGVFIDEMTSDAVNSHILYYQKIDEYIHNLEPHWTVVGNPGTNTPSSYAKVANELVLFENGTGYDTYRPPSWQTKSSPAHFANLVYDVSSTATMQADVQLAADRHTGWVYVTDANLPNPYGALPSYWTDLVDAVAANNSGIPGGGLTTTFFVSSHGSNANPGTFMLPFKTIQHALNVASSPGDTVEVRGGTYHEKTTLPNSGSSAGGFITLEAYQGEHPVLNGTEVASSDVGYGNDMVQIINDSYVKVIGFTIIDDKGTATVDASGVHVEGAGSNIEIRNNVIHDISGIHGMGISVYGTSQTSPLTNIVIDGNLIYHCRPADSETLTLNGNVSDFQITNNVVHDCNNIGIDMIGGEADIFGLTRPTPNLPVTRDGTCSGNTVYNIHANYGGGFAGGIYVDGGQNITVADNISYQNDMGLEVGAENAGYIAGGIIVENNLFYKNAKAGLVFGGFDASVGRVENCSFINNTVYDNDTRNTGNGQLWIQWASNNLVTNNIFVAAANGVLIGSFDLNSNVSNLLDHNLYFASPAANASFNWNGQSYSSFGFFQTGASEDADSLFADPKFVNAAKANFQLQATSPALDAGSSTSGQFAATDFTGLTRGAPPDIGAYENAAV